jgi:hypothetical protein
MDFGDTQTLVQAGAVGIAIALIILISLILKFTYKMMVTHMQNSDSTIKENAKAMTHLASVITNNSEAVNRNTIVIERVERILDRA